MHDKLVKDIESLEAKKAGIKATVATAKAQEQVNKATAGMSSSASISAFERMEDKANRRLDSALASSPAARPGWIRTPASSPEAYGHQPHCRLEERSGRRWCTWNWQR